MVATFIYTDHRTNIIEEEVTDSDYCTLALALASE